MEENKDLMDVLTRIEKTSRIQTWCSVLLCLLALAAAICCLGAFYLVYTALPQVSAVIEQMQTVLGHLEQVTEQLAALDLQAMISDVDALVLSAQESLELTMGQLNAIDFDTLNQAIRDLADVIQPLAKISNMFR